MSAVSGVCRQLWSILWGHISSLGGMYSGRKLCGTEALEGSRFMIGKAGVWEEGENMFRKGRSWRNLGAVRTCRVPYDNNDSR